MSEKISVKDVRMNKKAVIIRICILLAMIFMAGIATRLIPQGEFERQVVDGHTIIVEDSFRFLDSEPRPVYAWLTAPFRGLFSGASTIMIMLMLLFMGGIMVVLDKSKVVMYLVSYIIKKYGDRKYTLMYVLVLVMMLLGAVLAIYDSSGIFIPITLGIAFAAGWDSLVGIGLSYLPIALGFTVSILNPYVIGIPQSIAGLPVNSGMGLRFIFFIIMYLLYVSFLVPYAKKIEADPLKSVTHESDKTIRHLFPSKLDEEILKDEKVKKGAVFFVGAILLEFLYTFVSLFVPGLSGLAMPVMLILLLGGTIGSAILSGKVSPKEIPSGVLQGMKITAPAVLVLILIVGIRQIVVDGRIMDTLLYYCYNMIEGTSPYLAIFVILAITMLMEFVVGSASAKAFLILPLLVPLGNMVGLTSQTIVQAYAYGDGFSNAFYPTSTMLLIITGIINISFSQWYKFTGKLILRIVVFSILTLLLCVAVHYGPF